MKPYDPDCQVLSFKFNDIFETFDTEKIAVDT